MWRRKRTRTLLDFNLVKKRKFYEKQDENDQKATLGVRCVSCFVGPPPTFLASPATLNLFDSPGGEAGHKNNTVKDELPVIENLENLKLATTLTQFPHVTKNTRTDNAVVDNEDF